jgi:hypothetical protein
VTEEVYQIHKTQIDTFVGDAVADSLNLDIYLLLVLPEIHPQYNLFIADKAYWLHQFGYSRPNRQ